MNSREHPDNLPADGNPPAPSRPGLADLSPANFAMVMATGIVSIAAHLRGLSTIASALFWLNAAMWTTLCVLNTLRMFHHPVRFWDDMLDHLRGPGFFTSVAATAVLGSQCLIFGARFWVAAALWVVALGLWALLTYTIFAAFTIKEIKPTLDRGINGAWLLAVVSIQSLAVLGALLAVNAGQPWKLQLNFVALSMWLLGGMQYIWIMSLIFYRYTFFRFSASDLAPTCWINMGAMAISTLAGSLLVINAADAPLLNSLLPLIKGFTILYWATGTWWVPLLIVLSLWRYLHQRFPLRYDPLYWGAVFPLGMYSASTSEMIKAMAFDFLYSIPRAFLYAALIVWVAAFAGLLRRIAQRLRRTVPV